MSLTRNLRRTGRAASLEIKEARAEIMEAQLVEALKKNEQVKLALASARDELKALDPIGWEAWWDSEALPDAPYAVMLPVVLARIEHMKSERLKAIFRVIRNR
jgi:hypothetical protein